MNAVKSTFNVIGGYARSNPLMVLEEMRSFGNILEKTHLADMSPYHGLMKKMDDIWGISRIFQGVSGLCSFASTLHHGWANGALSSEDRSSLYKSGVKILKNLFLGSAYVGRRYQLAAAKSVRVARVLGKVFSIAGSCLEGKGVSLGISAELQGKKDVHQTAVKIHDFFDEVLSASSLALDLVVIGGEMSARAIFGPNVKFALLTGLLVSHLVSGVAQNIIEHVGVA